MNSRAIPSAQVQREGFGDLAVIGLQVQSDQPTLTDLQLFRDADLEPEGSIMEDQITHRGLIRRYAPHPFGAPA